MSRLLLRDSNNNNDNLPDLESKYRAGARGVKFTPLVLQALWQVKYTWYVLISIFSVLLITFWRYFTTRELWELWELLIFLFWQNHSDALKKGENWRFRNFL